MQNKHFTSLLVAFFLIFLLPVLKQDNIFAQTLSVSPTTVGCTNRVVFSATGLTPTEHYRLLVICNPTVQNNPCSGEQQIIEGGPNDTGLITGASGWSSGYYFDVNSGCSNGGFELLEGTYYTALEWQCTNRLTCGRAVMGPGITLTAPSGSCTLTPNLPFYAGWDGTVTLTNGNANTTYTVSAPGCNIDDPTVVTTSDGRVTFPINCPYSGMYRITATSPTSNPRNCSANFSVTQSAAPTSTPTPDTYCACAPGNCAVYDFCGEGYVEQCDSSNGTCTSSTNNCTCVAPTSALPSIPIATQYYVQCGTNCLTDTEHPYGNCLSSSERRDDICVRPASDPYGQIDCSINGASLDCWCCSELLIPTIREGINPLCSDNSINTAIGCLPVGDKGTFLTFVLRWALGIAGGVSLILIIYSGFIVTTSAGDKRRLQSGKELLTAAIAGLILIVFSVFILDIVGIRILKLPGL